MYRRVFRLIIGLTGGLSRRRRARRAALILVDADKLFRSGCCRQALALTEKASQLDPGTTPLIRFRKANASDKLSYELFLF